MRRNEFVNYKYNKRNDSAFSNTDINLLAKQNQKKETIQPSRYKYIHQKKLSLIEKKKNKKSQYKIRQKEKDPIVI